jgi:hypothetical protein
VLLNKALFDAVIPATFFILTYIKKYFERLQKAGVVFSMTPTRMGPSTIAVFNDTCGNNIQIAQV